MFCWHQWGSVVDRVQTCTKCGKVRTVVKEGRFGYSLGSHHKGFIPGTLEPFKGRIILSND